MKNVTWKEAPKVDRNTKISIFKNFNVITRVMETDYRYT